MAGTDLLPSSQLRAITRPPTRVVREDDPNFIPEQEAALTAQQGATSPAQANEHATLKATHGQLP